MIEIDEENKSLYILEPVNGEYLVKTLIKKSGAFWREWTIIPCIEESFFFDGDYDIPDVKLSKIDIFNYIGEN